MIAESMCFTLGESISSLLDSESKVCADWSFRFPWLLSSQASRQSVCERLCVRGPRPSRPRAQQAKLFHTVPDFLLTQRNGLTASAAPHCLTSTPGFLLNRLSRNTNHSFRGSLPACAGILPKMLLGFHSAAGALF